MKKAYRMHFLLIVCFAVLPVTSLAQEGGQVVEGDLKVEHGQVNWTDRVIVATGSGAPDLKAANVAVARLGAERVAKLDALRNIMETLKGVQLSSEVTVENEMVTSSKMRTKIEGMARNFKVLKTKYYSDGGVDLVVQMSLDGPLATTLIPPGTKAGEVPGNGQEKFSGLVVDARGLKAIPALSPRILDESGNVLYSAEVLDAEALEASGVVGYFKDAEAAKTSKRVAGNPLFLKALKVGGKTDIVLSNADAEKLRDPESNLKFLTQAKVIIVLD